MDKNMDKDENKLTSMSSEDPALASASAVVEDEATEEVEEKVSHPLPPERLAGDQQGLRLFMSYDAFLKESRKELREGRMAMAVDLNERKVLADGVVGKKIRILWPEDEAWYRAEVTGRGGGGTKQGAPETSKEVEKDNEKVKEGSGEYVYTILYEDGQSEVVDLGKESVRVYLKPLESADLGQSLRGAGGRKMKLTEQGNVVWARLKGYPPWPALVITPEEFEISSQRKLTCKEADRFDQVCLRFFGTYDIGQTLKVDAPLDRGVGDDLVVNPEKPNLCKLSSRPYDLWPFDVGVELQFHLKWKKAAFKRAVAEAEQYLLGNEIPDAMIPLYNDETCLDDEEDEVDVRRKGSNRKNKRDVPFRRSFQVGKYLNIEDIGQIEFEDARFHDERFLYPLGFKSTRVVQTPQGEDAQISCSITRYEETLGGGPAFTVRMGDGESFTRPSAQKAWQCLQDNGHIKNQVYSGHKLFGYSVSRVQKVVEQLEGAEWCDCYSPLDEVRWKDTERRKIGKDAEADKIGKARKMWSAVAQCPASLGFEPFEAKQEANKCAICNSETKMEYNQLVQCDTCSVLVHMGCVGIEEHKEGDVWRCSMCTLFDARPALESKPACGLCPCVSDMSILKPTMCGSWVHQVCAQWIPETTFSTDLTMVDNLSKVRKARLNLKCNVCHIGRGAKIQCSEPKCFISAHPLCARHEGWQMTYKEAKDGAEGVLLEAKCCKCMEKEEKEEEKRRQSNDRKCQERIEKVAAARCIPYRPTSQMKKEIYNSNYHVGRITVAKRHRRDFLTTEDTYAALVADSQGLAVRRAKKARSGEYQTFRLNTLVKIGKSPIHAWGLFAAVPIKKGTRVIEYIGEVTRSSLADMREQYYEKNGMDSSYLFRVGSNLIDATVSGGPARYINHSCDPNCKPEQFVSDNKIFIYSLRDIQPGEELYYDYKFDFESDEKRVPCMCGANNCCGWMN